MAAVTEIKLELLKIHPKNVRKQYEGIEELAQSIKENGIMQNLTVVPDPQEAGKYLVVIGNRRLTAARQAGIESVPCVIVDSMNEKEQVLTMLTENMVRKDLKIYEEAAGIQMCISDFGIPTEEVEKKTGLSKTTVYHRINIAKLNQKILQEKAESEDFQLSLQSLYILEQIKSVQTRNKILRESKTNGELLNAARREIRQQQQDATAKEIIKMCEKVGIGPAPKDLKDNPWSNQWEQTESFDLWKTAPKKIKSPKTGEKVYYLVRYSSLNLYKKAEKKKAEKEEKSAEELRREQEAKTQKKISTINKAILKDAEDFVRCAFDGKTEKPKDEEEIRLMAWELILNCEGYVSLKELMGLMENDYFYNIPAERKAEVEKKCKELPLSLQMLGAAMKAVRSLETKDWEGKYNQVNANKINKFLEILGKYGYSIKDQEWIEILDGSSDLYKKEKKGE